MTQTTIIPENWAKTKFNCPICKQSLYAINDPNSHTVWCPWGNCPSIGTNEGGHGKTELKAVEVLMAKMGVGKWVNETEEATDAEVSKTTDPSIEPKKRGRKSTGAVVNYTVPDGQFTIKEFCDLNKTYPVKALSFLKEQEIKECGKRPTANGRGKPATLYAKLNISL